MLEVHDWHKVLDVTGSADAVDELKRHIARLDGAHDEIWHTLHALLEAPGEIDGILRVARSCVGEAVDALHEVSRCLKADAELEDR